MKRYLLFSGSYYYPEGGWRDFKGSFDTELAAREAAFTCAAEGYDWAHVVDARDGKQVFEWGKP